MALDALYTILAIIGCVLWPMTLILFRTCIDNRWALLSLGFGWGAILAPLIAIYVGTGFLTAEHFPILTHKLVQTGIVRPVLEEFVKALGVVLIGLPLKRNMPNLPLGLFVLLGGTVGFGFAIGEAFIQSGVHATTTELLNSRVFEVKMVTGYLHVLTTGLVGFSLGIRHRRRLSAALIVGALSIHIANNSAAVIGRGLGIGFISFFSLLCGVVWFLISRPQEPRWCIRLEAGQ